VAISLTEQLESQLPQLRASGPAASSWPHAGWWRISFVTAIGNAA
jgi:hypothetical protein